MAIAPSRQFYPTSLFNSFQSSFSKFHANHIQIFSGRKQVSQCIRRRNACSGSWISKWDENRRDKCPIHSRAALDYSPSDSEEVSSSGFENGDGVNRGVSYGNNGGSTMEKIVEKLKKFGYMSDGGDKGKTSKEVIEKGSVEDIFYVEEGMLPNTRGGFSVDSPLGVESVFGGKGDIRFPWEKPKEEERERRLERTKSRTLAEMTLPELELRRLTNLTFQKKHKMKIGGGGVTQAVVDIIHEKWKMSEIVRLKIDGPPALNMKRMHEILERKTGGLVIWRSGTSLSLYRGVSYEDPAPQTHKKIYKNNRISSFPEATDTTSIVTSPLHSYNNLQAPKIEIETTTEDNSNKEVSAEVNYEEEVNKLLDDLGPRYKDWPGLDPMPVDADMLQGIVPGYQPPYRILPYGARRSLGIKEATSLRRLARVLPPHFALGRNRQLQGLAEAMVKLWEKSSIAKIALKRGVQLTTSERMAEEIKTLTGGFLLSRNKDFLVFYRGKDFLSPDVTEALLERERLAKSLQDEEEHARLRAAAFVIPAVKTIDKSGIAGTLGETMDADVKWGRTLDDQHKERIAREAEILRHNNLVRKLERKMSIAERKIAKAEKALFKVEAFLKPTNKQADPESISEEERYMFRKLGLRMKAFLLLGRRGVFDGTVENMHLHWKYRELVKIMVKSNSFEQVKKIALALEAESGGVLVSVDKVSKSYAIIVFRGKDYHRPSLLRPKNLLTKRKALARSIELQRHEALVNHISALQSKVDKLRSEIEQMENVKNQGNGTLYDKLESAYPTDDETETEKDGDDGDFPERSDEEYDGEDESNITTYDHSEETDVLYDDQDQDQDQDEESETESKRISFVGSI